MKLTMMMLANKLCGLLERCDDGDFVDRVVDAVACNLPFSEDELLEMHCADFEEG